MPKRRNDSGRATVVAATACELVEVPKSALERALRSAPHLVEGLVKAAKSEALVIQTLYSPFMCAGHTAGIARIAEHLDRARHQWCDEVDRQRQHGKRRGPDLDRHFQRDGNLHPGCGRQDSCRAERR